MASISCSISQNEQLHLFYPMRARTFHSIYKLQKHVLLRHQSYLIVSMGNKNLRFWKIMPFNVENLEYYYGIICVKVVLFSHPLVHVLQLWTRTPNSYWIRVKWYSSYNNIVYILISSLIYGIAYIGHCWFSMFGYSSFLFNRGRRDRIVQLPM
jgi:hypothetical protein